MVSGGEWQVAKNGERQGMANCGEWQAVGNGKQQGMASGRGWQAAGSGEQRGMASGGGWQVARDVIVVTRDGILASGVVQVEDVKSAEGREEWRPEGGSGVAGGWRLRVT